MEVVRIDYNLSPEPKDSISLIREVRDQGYSAPIDLMGPVRLFGRDNRYIAVGPHCMISVLQSTGQNLEYKDRPKQLPRLTPNTPDGYLIIPFGEQMVMRACGTKARMWVGKDRTVIAIQAKNAFTLKPVAFQVHFLFNTGVIEIHYEHCMTSSGTIIGACGAPEDCTDWGCDAYEDLTKTAISIDTNITVPIDETVDPPAPFPPPGPDFPDPEPEINNWGPLDPAYEYRRRLK